MAEIDPYGHKVGLLIHGNGVDGASSFTDSSLGGLALTPVGAVATSTAQSKFGGSSALFSSGGRILVPSSPSLAIGTGDFTIEGWLYTTDNSGTIGWMGTGTGGWWIKFSTTAFWLQGSNFASVNIALTRATNQWQWVEISRISGVLYFFVNGTLAGSAACTANLPQGALAIGACDTANSFGLYWTGNMEDVRITVGVGRHTLGYAPPTETLPDPVLATGSVGISLPAMGSSSYGGASASITLPGNIAVVGRSGALASMALPSLTATIQGHDSTGEQAANITLPSLSVTARAGANARIRLPSLSTQSAGTVTAAANAALTLPSLNVAAGATVSSSGSMALTLPVMRSKSYAGALCSVTIGSLSLQATGTTGSVGGAQITLPLFQATAIATAGNHGYANIVLPSLSLHSGGNGAAVNLPSLQLTAIGSATITVSYEAYAVNLLHTDPNANDEATRYTNFPFTHVVRYQNSYYGANSTGLYLLEGTTDAGTPIPWAVQTALTDFKTPNKKTLASAYFSGRFGPASTIKLIEGEKTPNTYSFTTPRGTLAQNHRQKFGKGTKGRYYALAASGTGTLELDGIECEVHQLTRRI